MNFLFYCINSYHNSNKTRVSKDKKGPVDELL